MERAFVDTSAWIAFANKREPAHAAVRDALKSWAGRLVTSSFVFDETVTLFRYSARHAAAVTVGETLLDARTVTLVRITAEDESAAWNLFRRRPDQEYSFTDCTSFELMRRLGIGTAIALDDDFRAEGFRVLP